MTTSDTANDTVATKVRTTRYGPADDVAWAPLRRRTRRMSHAVPMIMGGHMR